MDNQKTTILKDKKIKSAFFQTEVIDTYFLSVLCLGRYHRSGLSLPFSHQGLDSPKIMFIVFILMTTLPLRY